MKIFITGSSGFIGFHLSKKMVAENYKVIGIDNINDYYDPNLKLARLNELNIDTSDIVYNQEIQGDITFIKLDIKDLDAMKNLFKKYKFDYVVNLAAQAGVRYSLINPHSYVDNNITGFLNILECCRAFPVEHLVFASSSSVYGLSEEIPFNENNSTDHPLAMYAASKKANEMMAHSYAHLFNIPSTGLRFFTVYGPWGRPDMALFIFTKNILEGKKIDLFNFGNHIRDFTYIDDIIEPILRLINKPPKNNNKTRTNDPSESSAPFKIYNIGNNNPKKLMEFVKAIESKLNKKAKINLKPLQKGDVYETYADTNKLLQATRYKSKTDIDKGIGNFIDWFRSYYKC